MPVASRISGSSVTSTLNATACAHRNAGWVANAFTTPAAVVGGAVEGAAGRTGEAAEHGGAGRSCRWYGPKTAACEKTAGEGATRNDVRGGVAKDAAPHRADAHRPENRTTRGRRYRTTVTGCASAPEAVVSRSTYTPGARRAVFSVAVCAPDRDALRERPRPRGRARRRAPRARPAPSRSRSGPAPSRGRGLATSSESVPAGVSPVAVPPGMTSVARTAAGRAGWRGRVELARGPSKDDGPVGIVTPSASVSPRRADAQDGHRRRADDASVTV